MPRTKAKPLRRPGRPLSMAKGRKVALYLDAESLRRAAVMGNGNLSLGVRRALLTAEP